MLTKTYVSCYCLENVSSQLLYRALFPVAFMARKRIFFNFHMVTYEMDLPETLTTR